MAAQNRFRWLYALTVALFTSACSHTPSAGDIPPGAAFAARILTDGTKLFTYTVRVMRAGPVGDDRDGFDDMPTNRGARPERSVQFAQSAQRAIQALLAQNHYCRDGHVVLEQYDEHGKYIVRGECRDAATDADREKFSQ